MQTELAVTDFLWGKFFSENLKGEAQMVSQY
jgi:hypothetical protein